VQGRCGLFTGRDLAHSDGAGVGQDLLVMK
jgi:hypothetical protein